MSGSLNLSQLPFLNEALLKGRLLTALQCDGGKSLSLKFIASRDKKPVHELPSLYAVYKNLSRHSATGDKEYGSARKLAVITGATSGIGKAYAVYFASQGYNLLITGRRRDILLKVASGLKINFGVNVDIIIADLSRSEDLSMLLDAVGKRDNIEVLVNNAGFGMDNNFIEDEIEHQLSMLKVHVNAPVMLTHKVLPAMMQHKKGMIINVSSLSALAPTAGSVMYSSTKSFLKNFTESLHMDVSAYEIKVQCLCPGFTRSDFHRNLNRLDHGNTKSSIFWMDPSEVVDYSMRSLGRDRVICIPGFQNRILRLLISITPRSLYYFIAARLEKQYGRKEHAHQYATA